MNRQQEYRQHLLEPVIVPGSDFHIQKDGRVVARRPQIDYIRVKPLDGSMCWNEATLLEAKREIRRQETLSKRLINTHV